MREPRWATPRNRWLCMQAVHTPVNCHASCTIVTHYVWLSRKNHEAVWNVTMYARVCSQRQAYLP